MKTIDEDIKQGTFRNVYLLYGEEAYLLKQYKDRLVKAMVAENDNMNFATFTGKDVSVKEIIDLSETLPFFAERRVILIEDSGFFKNAQEELATYMGEIPKSTFLIFAETEVDKRGKLYKAVNKQGTVVEFGTQNEQLLTKWITGRIAKEGKKIATDAFELFLAMTGSDMENIPKELEKLLCYTLAKATITRDDVAPIPT